MTTSDDLTDFEAVGGDEHSGDEMMLPTGTVTFLLTDVEGSTRLWEADRGIAAAAIARHYELLDAAITLHGGARPVEQGEGDSVVAVFTRASDALAAALDMQRAIADEVWPGEHPLRIRMALHTGEAHRRSERVPRPGALDPEGNYSGPAIIRCARLRSIAHGGQTIVSDVARDLLVDNVPDGVTWRDLGSHRLKDLGRAERVWQLCHPDLEADFPPLRSLDVAPHNLPVELTTFVGREHELVEVREQLEEHRLVTLTGAGGCGKTRLALHVAAEELARYRGGVRWIELATVTDPALVPVTVATALGHHEDHGRPMLETLPEQLGELDLLAVLDNCEQVLDATAEFVGQLLQLLPRLKVIATSREPLGLTGEVSWRVPSLDPEAAQTLFVERARRARTTFDPDAEQLAIVARICARLDHLPLAIELAAARVRMMQPERIADALDDRFRLLTGGGRTVMPRQQTLEASVAWSHDLLDEQERAVLRRLAVFSGGFTLEAAEVVCADELVDAYAVLELMTRLVDKSLVQVDEECTRYRLLETIRQYARERLLESGESDDVRGRHLAFFFALSEDAAPHLEAGDVPTWLARLELEHDNLDTALGWAEATGAVDTLQRMTTALFLFFDLRGHLTTGGRWFAAALAADGPDTATRARALWGGAHIGLYAHDYVTFLDLAPRALAMADATGDGRAMARALVTFGYAEVLLDATRAKDTLARSVALAREIDDKWTIAYGIKMVTAAMMTQHKVHELPDALDELRVAADALGSRYFLAWYHTGTAFLAWSAGDIRTARREFGIAIEHCRAVGDPSTGSIAMSWLAEVDALAGDYDVAGGRLDALNRHGPEADAFNSDEPTEIAAGMLALRRQDPDAALRAVEPLVEIGDFVVPIWCSWASLLRGFAFLALDDEAAAETAFAQARHLAGPPLDNHWIAASADYGLGVLEYRRGNPRDAERLLHDALAVRHRDGFRPGIADALEMLAVIAADGESDREATRLFAFCSALRAQWGFTAWPLDRPHPEEVVARLCGSLGADEFAKVWAEGEVLTVDDAVAYATRARSERKRPSSGWDALTPTELRVVALAAEGLTNPQIAERLFIARGTVKIHLSHIFAKVGVATRAELASEATRRTSERESRAGLGR